MGVNITGNLNIGNGMTLINVSLDPNFLCASGAGTPEINGTYKFYDFYTYPFLGTRPRYIPINNVDLSGIQIDMGPMFPLLTVLLLLKRIMSNDNQNNYAILYFETYGGKLRSNSKIQLNNICDKLINNNN